jgi:2-polyprenyl-3-methyl-5-hydroxy-6-metoxy-1,4-benzoquinol methylase
MIKKIEACRICGNRELVSILHLGEQYLTGVFPKRKNVHLTKGPLELVKCFGKEGKNVCGLVQLNHSYDLEEMYGETYGYRSGLNQSMVRHLREKVSKVCSLVELKEGDVVIDIGSNDGTLLKAFPKKGLELYGVDPSAGKFRDFYTEDITLYTEFFPSLSLSRKLAGKKAKVVTSISMFYDLEEPQKFVNAIKEVLHPEGIWVFEQSYLPTMLETSSYDTVCHEHLEYYCLRQIKWMMAAAGLKIVDVELNNVNGGSFSITVANLDSKKFNENIILIEEFQSNEKSGGFDGLGVYEEFKKKIQHHRADLVNLLSELKKDGKKVIGYGASTKGNVLLQYCGITTDLLSHIAEVNEDKFGAFTPGSQIPIISETEAKKMEPDYLLILPWHFKQSFLEREKEFLQSGGKLIFPLPLIEIITKEKHVDPR